MQKSFLSFWLILLLGGLTIGGCGGRGTESGEEGPRVTITTLQVEGMTCESCEEAIRETVGRIEGVHAVEAHHDPGNATVSFDVGQTSIEDIIGAIEVMGYSVVGSAPSGTESSPSESS